MLVWHMAHSYPDKTRQEGILAEALEKQGLTEKLIELREGCKLISPWEAPSPLYSLSKAYCHLQKSIHKGSDVHWFIQPLVQKEEPTQAVLEEAHVRLLTLY